MNWGHPELLALLLGLPAVLVLLLLAERARRRALAALGGIEAIAALIGTRAARIRGIQAGLAFLAAAAMGIAAAGPRLGFEWQQRSMEGVSLVVVLDVSRSMDAADAPPSRLEQARREILDLVGLLRGDAVGLVIFAAGPYVRIPLTVDYDTFRWAIADSSSDTIRAQGTSLAGALDAAVGLLDGADGSGKAVLVVSDGEGHDASEALDAALARARTAGVRVYALGVGDPDGAPIPLATGGFKKDASGNVVLSRLDEAALTRLASATGGAYVRAVPSDDDVRALYVDEIRGKLDAAERGVRREKLWHERYQWPLGVALLAMAVSAALGIRPRARGARSTAAAAVLLAGALLHASPAFAAPADDGLTALRAGDYARAAELLGQARVHDPGDVTVANGLAEALYRSGRYREAEQLYRSLASTDRTNAPTHLYNAGSAAYRGGRLAEALRDFKDAATAKPDFAAAQQNATAVEREIAARTSPPPPKQQDEQPQSGDSQQADAAGQEGSQSPREAGQPQDGGQQDGAQADADGGSQTQPQPGQQAGQEGGGEQGDGQGASASADGNSSPQAAQGKAGGQPPQADAGDPTATEGGLGDASGGDGTREVQATGGQFDPNAQDGALSAEAGDATATAQGAQASGTPTGSMTAEQAARLVDSIPDGRPRVVVGGSGTEKDW